MKTYTRVLISEDGQTAYLLDKKRNILAQASMTWFNLCDPTRKQPPSIAEIKEYLLKYYNKIYAFNVKKLDKVKKKPRKDNGKFPKRQRGTQELFSDFSEGITKNPVKNTGNNY